MWYKIALILSVIVIGGLMYAMYKKPEDKQVEVITTPVYPVSWWNWWNPPYGGNRYYARHHQPRYGGHRGGHGGNLI